jgi:hypothetical protein
MNERRPPDKKYENGVRMGVTEYMGWDSISPLEPGGVLQLEMGMEMEMEMELETGLLDVDEISENPRI